jgi:hypothetical protein
MKVIRYKLRLIRVEFRPDSMDPGYKQAFKVEEGPFLKANKEDVTIAGYAKAINRAGELNDAIKKEGKWEDGWRYITVQIMMEEQQNLFDVDSGDQANAPA